MNFSYEVAEDGLSMTARWVTSTGGTAKSTVSWPDLKTAQANYENFKKATEKHFERLEAVEPESGMVRNKIRRFRFLGQEFTLFTSGGAPVWWKPSFRYVNNDTQLMVGAGWLYFAVHLNKDKK